MQEAAREPLEQAEVGVWSRTAGFRRRDAAKLAEFAAGVRDGRRFMAVGSAIGRDHEMQRKMVDDWVANAES